MPVFLAQGTTGTTVRPAVTEDYTRSLCKAGSPVRMMAVPKVGHAFIGRDRPTRRSTGCPTASTAAPHQAIAESFAGG